MSKPDGGQAFPQNDAVMNRINNEAGMTLRDYFAAAAMQGMLAYSHLDPMKGNWQENASPDAVAAKAYSYADAMIAERSKG